MKVAPNKKHRSWDTKRVHFFIRKGFKNRFDKRITTKDINKIWSDYVDEIIIKPLEVGSIVKMDKNSKIWVMATPILEHKRAVTLLKKGLMYKNGRIVEANINFDSSKYIYKVMYENILFDKEVKLFYKPHRNISDSVKKGIINGNLITRFKCQ